MSTKTTFKRIALVAVAALGLGVLSVAPSSATVQNETLTLSATTASINVNETATITVTSEFFASSGGVAKSDSRTILASQNNNVGGTASVYIAPTSDTVNTLTDTDYAYVAGGTGILESAVVTGLVRAKYNVYFYAPNKAGTYYLNIYSQGSDNVNSATSATQKSGTVVITVSAGNTTPAGMTLYVDSDHTTAANARFNQAAATDSAVVVDRGTAATYTPVAWIYGLVTNSAGETTTATTKQNICSVTTCTITVTTDLGELKTTSGMTTSGQAAGTAGFGKSASITYTNASTAGSETITVLSDGSVGTATLRFYYLGAQIATKTITFTGPIASISQAYFADTRVAYGLSVAESATVYAYAKDAGGNIVKPSAVGAGYYLAAYSSDTAVAGPNTGTAAAQACSVSSTTGKWTCNVTVKDSGSVTITLRDSSTVATSSASFAVGTLTTTGATMNKLTATWDKATYLPGEKAILTLTGKDQRGELMTNNTYASAFVITSNWSPSYLTGAEGGTQNGGTTATTFSPYLETGVETRVVYMPTVGGAVTYTIRPGGTSDWTTTVVASATVADPTKDAADAATDAALEATDAAYAAQDAAQLAAEAADAATAAAEAATAAVEDLATQVASLFADLQKQITTLANVVAKIAKKVKA